MKKELSSRQMELTVADIEETQLLKWFEKWSDSPWLYSIVSYLKKLPFYLVILLIFDVRKLYSIVSNPIGYVEQKGGLLIIGTVIFIVLFRIHWNHKAVKYYLLSKIHPSFVRVEYDHLISKIGKRAEVKVPARYERWSDKKILMQVFFAIALPLLFLVVFYIGNGLKNNIWSLNDFTKVFETTEAFVTAIGIMMLFGIAMGYGLWRQVKDDYILFTKAKS